MSLLFILCNDNYRAGVIVISEACSVLLLCAYTLLNLVSVLLLPSLYLQFLIQRIFSNYTSCDPCYIHNPSGGIPVYTIRPMWRPTVTICCHNYFSTHTHTDTHTDNIHFNFDPSGGTCLYHYYCDLWIRYFCLLDTETGSGSQFHKGAIGGIIGGVIIVLLLVVAAVIVIVMALTCKKKG